MQLTSAMELRDTIVAQMELAPAVVAYAADAADGSYLSSRSGGAYMEGRVGWLFKEAVAHVLVPATTAARRSTLGLARRTQLARPGIGIAPTTRDGDYQLAIRVSRKSALTSPLVERMTKAAKGEVNIRVTGSVNAQEAYATHLRSRRRPLTIGSSIGQGRRTGSLGCFVRLASDPDIHLLSANHILADCNRNPLGAPVTQPGVTDGGDDANDVIGNLSKFVPIDPDAPNSVDAATCRLIDPRDWEPAKVDGHSITSVAEAASIRRRDPVIKIGRTTGTTQGRVTVFGFTQDMNYPGGLTITLSNLVEIESSGGGPFSRPGDSGALIVRPSDHAGFALLDGGDDYGYTFASPLAAVLGTIGGSLVV